MAEQGVVVAIRLSDVSECDQPDPLCLRAEDLSKWLHLEVLLRNMYRDPPQAIKVTYLDNEDDWVQISCDEELMEAVRITQQSDNILLFQVKRLDPLITFENKQPANKAPDPERQFPSVQTDGATLRNISQPLMYPHTSGAPIPAIVAPSNQVPLIPLVYPHPITQNTPLESATDPGPDGNVLQSNARGKTPFESRPEVPAGEKLTRLKGMLSPESIRTNQAAQGLNSLSSGSVWEQASSLSSREKLKFLKDLIPSQGQQNSSSTTGVTAPHRPEQISSQDLLVEPLCPENGSLGKNALANQDPFESMSLGHPESGLKQAQLLQPTLAPLKASSQAATTKTPNVALEIETDAPRSGNTENIQEAVRSTLSTVARSSHQQQPLSAEKGRIGKTVVTPPVPLPRTLQMMEGAQSGANAVAIEIPESYHGAAHKEEDVTASGGAACTSASAETGEGVPDGNHHAAAYGREVKSSADPSAVSAITRDSRVAATQISPSQLKKKSSAKKKSDAGKPESGGGAKRKENGGKDHSIKKRPSAEKSKKDNGPVKKEEKKVKADVESGEKTVSQAQSPAQEEFCAHLKDIVKYMRRMKKELHTNIVKDVTKQTDKLMRKNMERSMSCDSTFLRDGFDRHSDLCHNGVYCDNCNCVISGIRYKCGNCPDYDLCAKCETLPNVHDHTHVFIKLRRPASRVGVEEPLLRENIYLNESHVESNSDDSAEGFSHLSQKSVDDIPLSPQSIGNDELEIFKWYWDSFGTGHSEGSMDIESMPKLSKTEMKKIFQMLNSQEQAEDFTHLPKELQADEEDPDKTSGQSEVANLSLPSVEEEDQAVEEVQTKETAQKELSQCEEVEVAESSVTDFSFADRESASDYQEIDNAESQDDQDDQIEEVNVSVDENFNVPRDRIVSEEDSDSSDDFCVIDPPPREEFETCGMEFSTHSEGLVPLLNACLEEEKDMSPPLALESDSDESRSFSTIVKRESMLTPVKEKAIQESMEKDLDRTDENEVSPSVESIDLPLKGAAQQSVNEDLAVMSENSDPAGHHEVAQKTEDGGTEVAAPLQTEKCSAESVDEDYLLKMSPKERQEFLSSVDALREKARLLEQQLNEQKGSEVNQTAEFQKEEEVQLILKAKRKEAMMENEKLERMNMKQVAEKLQKWQSVQDQMQREEKFRLQREKEQRYKAHLQSLNKNKEKPTEAQINVPTSEAPLSPSSRLEGHGNIVYVQTKKDANCQTHSNMDPATQASQMFQQLTHGVSKAATTAFSTAKDVIYSLQAKQFEKKTASHSQKPVQQPAPSVSDDTWTPPASVWTPPKDNFIPPKSEWTPPKSEWTPPKDEYVPPKSEWIPPKDEYVPPKSDWTPCTSACTPSSDEKKPPSPGCSSPREDTSRPQSSRQQKKEAGRHSQDSHLSPTNSISPIPMADLTLHEELKAMQRLQEMGFANREQNRKLLQQFDGDLEKVVQSLLQEEGGEHWASYRH